MREPRDTTGNPVGRRAFERGDRVWHMGIAEYGTVTRVASGDPSAWVDAKFTYIGGHRVQGDALGRLIPAHSQAVDDVE